MTAVRLVEPQDAEQLVEALAFSPDHLAHSFPTGWFERLDVDLQRTRIKRALDSMSAGLSWPGVIVSASGQLVGRVALNEIVRGNRLSCFISYWLREDACGQGHATRAVRFALGVAFRDLALHRVEAFVRPSNAPSLAVLRRTGFDEIGIARRHTFVGSDWQDEVLLQRIAPWDARGRLESPHQLDQAANE